MTGKIQTHDIVHITDCHDTNPEGGFLAATKVKLAYAAHVEEIGLPVRLIEVTPAEEFNTIDVGAKFSEILTSNPNPARLIVAVNAAPPSIPGGNNINARINFVCGRLKNGAVFGGTYGGHCLSYVKSQIVELYELLDSNNGSQFRSLEVLPRALVEFAAGVIRPERLGKLDIAKAVPDAPEGSHVYAIDNFGNVKIILSEADRSALNQWVARTSDVAFAFGERSLEFGQPKAEPQAFCPAILNHKMFSAAENQTIVSLTSSSKRWDRTGAISDVAQIATIRREPGKSKGFTLPRIGAPVHFRSGAAA
jgi:hypothetical protein